MKAIIVGLFFAALIFGAAYFLNKISPSIETEDGKTKTSIVEPEKKMLPDEIFEPLGSLKSSPFIKSAMAQDVTTAKTSKTSPRTMGDEKAAVKMYVFSSLTCFHCASFHTKTLKEIEENYVKAGKVFFTYVDFPLDNKGSLAGAMLARCVPVDNYFTFLNVLFENQEKWAFKSNAQEIVSAYAALQGLSKGDVRTCLADKDLQRSIISTRDKYMKQYNIEGTPTTVLIKGDRVEVIAGVNEQKLKNVLDEMVK